MNSIEVFRNLGFAIEYPTFFYSQLNEDNLLHMPLREFASPYKDIDEKIGGNLFNWLKLGFNVLCKVDAENNSVLIFKQTTAKLAERFNVQLENKDPLNVSQFNEFVRAYATSYFIIEKIVFRLECKRLMNAYKPINSGLLKYFQYWLISMELNQMNEVNKYWKLFQAKFGAEVNQELFTQFTIERIGNSFVHCFFRCVENELVFLELLHKETGQPLTRKLNQI
jgi:hypothetical protein